MDRASSKNCNGLDNIPNTVCTSHVGNPESSKKHNRRSKVQKWTSDATAKSIHGQHGSNNNQ